MRVGVLRARPRHAGASCANCCVFGDKKHRQSELHSVAVTRCSETHPGCPVAQVRASDAAGAGGGFPADPHMDTAASVTKRHRHIVYQPPHSQSAGLLIRASYASLARARGQVQPNSCTEVTLYMRCLHTNAAARVRQL
jgi:hypothetical protein